MRGEGRGGGSSVFFLSFAVPLEKLDNLAISKGSIIQYSATHEMWVVLFYNRNSDTYFFFKMFLIMEGLILLSRTVGYTFKVRQLYRSARFFKTKG